MRRIATRGALLAPLLVLPHLVLGQAVVRGIVADSGGTAIRGTMVEILTLHRSVTTDNQGLFMLSDVPAGRHTVLAKAVGYYPRSLAILIARADTLRLTVRHEPAPVTLDPITVEETAAESLNPLMAGFADRRRSGEGEFLGPDDLSKLAQTSLPEVLRQFGLTISQSARGPALRNGAAGWYLSAAGLPRQRAPAQSALPLRSLVSQGGDPGGRGILRRRRAGPDHV